MQPNGIRNYSTLSLTSASSSASASSSSSSLKQGWLNLNDGVVVKQYVECLNEQLESYTNKKNQQTAINMWYYQWNNDREMRKNNGETFYDFSVLEYAEALREEQQQLQDIKLLKENQEYEDEQEFNDFQDIYA